MGRAPGTSDFFHLLWPPLFPMLAADYGFSCAELGLLVTVFFVSSGVGQAMAGFLVDRVGAWPVLMGAMAFFALAALAAAGAQDYWGFVLAAALAGVGNAPFHPADFSILNQRVSTTRLGHAFSVHGISGTLGWAAAPLVIAAVAGFSGSLRSALVDCAAWAVPVAWVVWVRGPTLGSIAAVKANHPPLCTAGGLVLSAPPTPAPAHLPRCPCRPLASSPA